MGNSVRHKRRTLVIGGAGFIGTHLVRQLLAMGREVTVLGRRARPTEGLREGAIYVSGDFSRSEVIAGLLDSHQEIVHLAYATVPNTSFQNPLEDLLQNLPPTVQLFAEAAARGTRLLLVSSGGTVYGEAISTPIREDHPTEPISPYGVTKLTLERYGYHYASTHGLRFICVRPANAYGVGQQPFTGQGFISTAMGTALNGEAIRIFGKKGTIRDYIYVSDVAAAMALALDSGQLYETYNIGSGQGLTNMDVILAMTPLFRECGIDITVDHLPERVFDVKSNILDATKLRDHTGWEPMIDFEEGLRNTRDWLTNGWVHAGTLRRNGRD